jgi:hypothetical protein
VVLLDAAPSESFTLSRRRAWPDPGRTRTRRRR